MSASVAPECTEVKDRYDSCFLKWYSESEWDVVLPLDSPANVRFRVSQGDGDP